MKPERKIGDYKINSTRVRGTGRVYQRGSTWWIGWYKNGHEIRESADTDNYDKAVRLLNSRVEQSKRPEFVGPSEKRLLIGDLEAKITSNYQRNGQKSLKTALACLKPVKEFFKYDRLIAITPSRIEAYTQARLDAGFARSTINLELRFLRRGFKLLHEAREISVIPAIHLLSGENIREGFVNTAEFHAALALIKSRDTADVVEFLYASAWRSSEAMNLTWAKFDHADWVFRLSRKDEKTRNPRVLTLPEGSDLRDIIERRLKKRLPSCPYVFHRNGKPVRSFRKAFTNALQAVGITAVPHDLRRSAIRNFTKAGISESEGMSISGHRTNSTYRRYNIVDESVQRAALSRVAIAQREGRKVVPIRR